MRWEPADFAVGLVVLMAVLILATALLWVSPALRERTYPIYTEFDRIDGIAEQAPVHLRGWAIGRVEQIEPRLATDGSLLFRVRMNIRWRLASGDTLYLPQGTTARLVPPQILGAGSIVLVPPPEPGPPLKPGDLIPGSRTTGPVDQLQELAEDLSDELVATLGTSRALMDTLTAAVVDVQDVMRQTHESLSTTTAQIPDLLGGVQEQLSAAQALTDDLRLHLDALTPAAVASLDSATALLGDSRQLVLEISQSLASAEPELTSILANLDTTTLVLHHFLREVTARPWRLFSGVRPPTGLSPTPPSLRDTTKAQDTTAGQRP